VTIEFRLQSTDVGCDEFNQPKIPSFILLRKAGVLVDESVQFIHCARTAFESPFQSLQPLLILWDIRPRQEALWLLEDLLEGFGMMAEIGNHTGCAVDLLVNLQDLLGDGTHGGQGWNTYHINLIEDRDKIASAKAERWRHHRDDSRTLPRTEKVELIVVGRMAARSRDPLRPVSRNPHPLRTKAIPGRFCPATLPASQPPMSFSTSLAQEHFYLVFPAERMHLVALELS